MKKIKGCLVGLAVVGMVLFLFVSVIASIGRDSRLRGTPNVSSIQTRVAQTFVAPYTQTAEASVPTSVSIEPDALSTFEMTLIPTNSVETIMVPVDSLRLFSSTENLSLRASPDTSGNLLALLGWNEEIFSLDSEYVVSPKIGVMGEWVHVYSPTRNLVGYVAAWYVSTTPNLPSLVIPQQSPSHPAGTSGKCKDGSYTYSSHKQGACSSHKGIAEWWGN